MLVGVTGRAQHGKDTIGQRLVDRWDFERMAFADKIKELALRVNPWVERFDFPKHPTRLATLVELKGWEYVKTLPEARRILQELGHGAREVAGGDVWIRALEQEWLTKHPQNMVITDVRYPNEEAWIHRHNGALLHVLRLDDMIGEYRAEGVDPNHESERFVPYLKADYLLDNDGSIADLERKVDAIAADLFEGFGA